MLYIGEKVGMGVRFTEVVLAVDPLEGTNLCATGAPNAIAVLAASNRGGLLHAPDLYMEKLVVGPSSKNAVNLDAPVHENLKGIARSLDRAVEDLVGYRGCCRRIRRARRDGHRRRARRRADRGRDALSQRRDFCAPRGQQT